MWHERLGTILIVITLTGLIWFFADRANTDSKTIKVLVNVQPAVNVVVLGQHLLEFDVTVHAPRGVISEIVNETQGRPLRANLSLDENVGTGEQTFNAARTLAQLDVIQQRGLTIDRVQPETFMLDIDKLVRVPTVRIKPEFGNLLVDAEDPPNPSTVSVVLPRRLMGQLAGDVLPVDISRYVDTTQPGVAMTRTVNLGWPDPAVPGATYVRFDPEKFTVRFRLKDTTGTKKFESVQVDFKVMPDVDEKYRVERPDKSEWRPTVTVSGPQQRIESLQKDEIELYVKIGPEDAYNVGKPIQRSVSVRLPPGITLEGTRPEVKFVLQDRQVPAATGG